MNRKMSRRQRDIKSKLMAAISMLLVSSIMMVSSTYAWFTLSTAPEVKGITTAVGANGNLEMALLPIDGKVTSIKSGETDSMDVQAKTAANITWGNLVDVSGDYGLEHMMLYPSALNFMDNEKTVINPVSPVAVPVFGADGRVASLAKAKATTGVYSAVNGNEMAFLDTVDIGGGQTGTGYGVRAIGVQSDASPALLAYKGALASANSGASQAIIKARGILKSKGGSLADLAIRKMDAASDDDKIYKEDDKTNLQAMVTAIYGEETNKGSLLIIRDALKEYMVAYHIATNPDNYTTDVATIRGWTELDPDDALVPANLKPIVQKLSDAIGNAKLAQQELDKLTGGSYSWTEISKVVNPLANPSLMTLNGIKISELMANVGKLAEDILGNKGLTLALTSGAGVFVDIADFCGDYSAQVVIPEIKNDNIPTEDHTLKNLTATMTTVSNINPTYLSQAQAEVQATGGPSDTGNTAQPITDFYGYIIDLAFKTNVAGSNLKLQTTAVDRIYNGNDKNEDTMGGGSSMIFTTSDPEFMPDEMFNLLKHMKVVLFNKEDGTIYKYLTIPATVDSAEITGTDTINVPLYVADASGLPAMDGEDFDGTITALDQNVPKQISVLVYLDGTLMTNADIASKVETMRGSLNLQFCSSEELTPMEYYDLRNGVESSGDNDNTPTPTTVDIKDKVDIDDKYVVTEGRFVTTGDNHAIAVAFTEGGTAVTSDTVTVTINGVEATYEHEVWSAGTTATEAPDTVTVGVTPK